MIKILDKIKIPSDRYEMRLSGSGGQGMIFASVVLSKAIGIGESKNVVQCQSYGPEARGGASKADVVVSVNEIYYPKAMNLDLLLAMTQESLDKYYPDLKKGGILIIDSSMIDKVPTDNYYALEFTRMARSEIGHIMVANVIALGAIAAISKLVSLEKLTEVVIAHAPKGTEEKNRKAVELGYYAAMETLKKA